MIKRKFRSQQLEGKIVKMPGQYQQYPDIVLLQKDDNQNFPKILRMSSQPKLPSANDSFTSGIRNKLIRDVYTPSQEDLLNRSIRKLNSSTSSLRQSYQKQPGVRSNTTGSRSQSQTRKTSAHQQVRMINQSFSQDRSKNAQQPVQIQGLQSLSKLVDYNLYRNHPSSNRQTIYDKARTSVQLRNITNPSIIKVKNMQSTTSSASSVLNATKKRQYNQPKISDRPIPVEVNGNSISFSKKSNPPMKSSQNPAHFSLPQIKVQSSVSSGPIQQRKKLMFRNEPAQLNKPKLAKENNIYLNSQHKNGSHIKGNSQMKQQSAPSFKSDQLAVVNSNSK